MLIGYPWILIIATLLLDYGKHLQAFPLFYFICFPFHMTICVGYYLVLYDTYWFPLILLGCYLFVNDGFYIPLFFPYCVKISYWLFAAYAFTKCHEFIKPFGVYFSYPKNLMGSCPNDPCHGEIDVSAFS